MQVVYESSPLVYEPPDIEEEKKYEKKELSDAITVLRFLLGDGDLNFGPRPRPRKEAVQDHQLSRPKLFSRYSSGSKFKGWHKPVSPMP